MMQSAVNAIAAHTAQMTPAQFFGQVRTAFCLAERNTSDSSSHWFQLGGFRISLRFAGSSLVPLLTPALEHRRVEEGPKADLTVYCWDSISTGVPMPPPPWENEAYYVRGEIKGFNIGMIRTTFNLGSGILSILNLSANEAVYWIRDAQDLPYYERGAPLITILNWWMSEHQRQLLHAAAVGRPDGGVLLVGRGGSGKSSTALACLGSDLVYVSDDYCLLAIEPAPYVHSIFCTGKVNATDRAIFPFLDRALSNHERLDTEKALFFLHRYFPGKIVSGFPIKAIFLPKVMGRPETTISPVSSAASLMALAPSTIFQLPGAGQEVFEVLGKLVRQVPSYILGVGTDRTKIPTVISRFLAEG